MSEERIAVRDNRQPGWHWQDNEIIIRYGQVLGPYGVSIYAVFSLLAHNESGECRTTCRQLANLLSISVAQASRSIKSLLDNKLLEIKYQSKSQYDGPSIYRLLRVLKMSAQELSYFWNTGVSQGNGSTVSGGNASPSAVSGRNATVSIGNASRHCIKRGEPFLEETVAVSGGNTEERLRIKERLPQTARAREGEALALVDTIRACWPEDSNFLFDPDVDGAAIATYLDAHPGLHLVEMQLLIVFRFKSVIVATLPIHRWLPELDAYSSGPQDKNGAPRYAADQLAAFRKASHDWLLRRLSGNGQPEQLALTATPEGAEAADEDSLRGFSAADLAPRMLSEFGIVATGQFAIAAEGAIRAKSGETIHKPERWTHARAYLHIRQRMREYMQSEVWPTGAKKSWDRWLMNGDYDNPESWKCLNKSGDGNRPKAALRGHTQSADGLIAERKARREKAQ